MEKDLIKALGGNRAVADVTGVSPTAVANWKLKGRSIPWNKRHIIARMAAERGVPLPDDFWAETAA